jgi:hypothetical protein
MMGGFERAMKPCFQKKRGFLFKQIGGGFMKRFIVTSLLFLLCSMIFGQSVYARSFQNEPDGFRGIKWGTDIKEVNNLVYIDTDPSYGGVKKYERKGDEYTIGAAQLNSIIYCFWNDKLMSVTVTFENFVNYNSVKEATTEKFGRGFKHNRYMEEFAWLGDRTTIMLKYNEISKKGSLYMSSVEMVEQATALNKKKAKEGAQKGF